LRAGAETLPASVPQGSKQTTLVRRSVRVSVIAISGWYVVLIAARGVLMVVNLLWP
jgi:ribosomal protein L36